MDVSIITPVKDGAEFVKELYDNLKILNFDFEWIIVDDGSADLTVEICREIERDAPFPVILVENHENRGGCYSRNRGIAASSGEYLKFLDVDDCLESNHFEIEGLCSVDMHIRPYRTVYESDASVLEMPCEGFAENPLLSFVKSGSIHHSACLFRRELVEKIAGWDESLWADQDGDFLRRFLMLGPTLRIYEDGVLIYRKHSAAGQVSRQVSPKHTKSRIYSLRKFERLLKECGRYEELKPALAALKYKTAIRIWNGDQREALKMMKEANHVGGAHLGNAIGIRRPLSRCVGCYLAERIVRTASLVIKSFIRRGV